MLMVCVLVVFLVLSGFLFSRCRVLLVSVLVFCCRGGCWCVRVLRLLMFRGG